MRIISAAVAGLFLAAVAGATPITLIFSGTGSGSVGTTAFSNAPFTFTFNSDTTALITSSPPESQDTETPNPTSNTFMIGSITGQLTGLVFAGPSVFLNPNTNNVGIWYFQSGDWLVTANGAYTASFGLDTNLGPVTSSITSFNCGGCPSGTPDALFTDAMPSTAGAVNFTSISNITFQEIVSGATGTSGSSGASGSGGGTPAAVPEPSTLLMIALGIAGVGLGKFRRHA